MGSKRVAEVVERIKTLTPAERREVRAAMDTLIRRSSVPLTEEDFARQLVAEGLVSAPSPREVSSAEESDWEPVPVSGAPVSQTIIDERR